MPVHLQCWENGLSGPEQTESRAGCCFLLVGWVTGSTHIKDDTRGQSFVWDTTMGVYSRVALTGRILGKVRSFIGFLIYTDDRSQMGLYDVN